MEPTLKIITDETTVNRKIGLRSNKIIISNPQEGDMYITFKNEKVILDDGVTISSEKYDNVTLKVADYLTRTVTFTDAITSQEVTISTHAIIQAMESLYVEIYNELYGPFEG
jgi:hypothetical protein